MAAYYDFTSNGCQGTPLEVGATFSQQLVWSAETPTGSGVFLPVNITGYSAKMQIRKSPGAPLILEVSTVNGYITLTPLLGILNIVVPATVTASLASGLYKYDLDITDSAGFVTRFIQGAFEIVATITQ